ncbi:hypothetical protein TWF730_004282 [Orbilia blumenaviensis]|uniref:Peptidase metallopeptidase domain-containing protein n=1 Tax=Orbilia blumenaviensis TaxID=1796055 RepID=A0AAV9U053_9PEZI
MDADENTKTYFRSYGMPASNWHSIPDDFPDVAPLILNKPWVWPNGSVITCKFISATDLKPEETENPLTPRVRRKIEQYAHSWEAFANIKFQFVDSGPTDIRITLVKERGAYSEVGTSCKSRPQNIATMNYGWFYEHTDDKEFRRTATHEFGHALGCVHEQFNPSAKFAWITKNVYAYYADPEHGGWDTARVDLNFNNFQPVDAQKHDFTHWDPKSIMHYPIMKDWTEQGYEVGLNTSFSDFDKEFIARIYPK